MAQTTLNNRQIELQAPEGFLINGKIVPSVASDNLTVALKTLAGNDPSTSDPIYIRLDNTIRTITSALSVDTPAGTNWFNSGSSELATKEVDYFVYLGYGTVSNRVFIAYSRIPYAKRQGELNTTVIQSERFLHRNETANDADAITVIGRFSATLSAGAGYTWTVPTFTPTNLIQRPIYETRWLEYNPIYTGSSSMTWTSVTGTTKYKINNTDLHCLLDLNGTTGGTSSYGLQATVPFSVGGGVTRRGFGCAVRMGAGDRAGVLRFETSTKIEVRWYDVSNFTLGPLRGFTASPIYEI